MKNVITWFEIPVKNIYRARDFYSTIFRVDIEILEVEDVYMAFLPHEAGGVGGAIVESPENEPSDKGVLPYLNGGDDLRTVLERVEAAGGIIIQKRTQISERHGFMAIFSDTEGNRIALHSKY